MSLDQVRAVADAVLYEGYLLYPYRASARKNQVRWQFGVLGPPGAAGTGGEDPGMATECVLVAPPGTGGGALDELRTLRVTVRFLQLQARVVERYDAQAGCFVPTEDLVLDGTRWLSWDEAVEHEVAIDFSASELARGTRKPLVIDGHEEVVELAGPPADGAAIGAPPGRVVRRRWPLAADVTANVTRDGGLGRLAVGVDNTTSGTAEADPRGTAEADPRGTAVRTSLLGTHLVLQAEGARFASLVDPPATATAAAGRCAQHRCWPVLAGEPTGAVAGGQSTSSVVLVSPIILYDFPEVAEQSAGALFDSTEIDEILTLRVMTMTEEEKAEARATDPRAGEIIDRCDHLGPADLQQLHGILRDPHAPLSPPAGGVAITRVDGAGTPTAAGATDVRDLEPPTFGEPGTPWWDPAADEAVRPDLDAVMVDGVPVTKGSLVRVHPSRRADAQDLFFTDQVARVTAVLSDVDGGVHVALVLADDPGADLHDWYGRYWYFAPDELEPLTGPSAATPATEHTATEPREESRS